MTAVAIVDRSCPEFENLTLDSSADGCGYAVGWNCAFAFSYVTG